MNHFSFLFSPMAEALGYTLLYSLWQAFIVSLCLRLILKFIPNAASRIKYLLSYFAYLVVALWFISTLFIQFMNIKSVLFSNQLIESNFLQHTTLQATTQFDFPTFSFSFINNYVPFVTGFYLLGMMWFSLKLILNYFQTIQLKNKALTILEDEWQVRILQLSKQMKIDKKVVAFFSYKIESPVMVGFFKPVILLPFATLNHLSVQQFEAILLHELAHIRRNDYLFNLLQSVLDILLFFNPFTWWITKNIRSEREKCCDEMVLEISDPHHYAHALLALEEPARHKSLLMTAVGNRSQLLHRIKNIMEMKNNHINLRQKFIALLVIVAGTVSVAWLSPKEVKSTPKDQQTPVLKSSFLNFDAQAGPSFSMNNFPFNIISDTTPKINHKVPKAPTLRDVTASHAPVPPLAPVAPLPAMAPVAALPALPAIPAIPALPALPPLAPLPAIKNDTFPRLDSYFKSEEWKKQQDEIRKSTLAMQKYFRSDAWKKQQELIKKNGLALKKYFESPEWKKQQQEIQKNTKKMQEYFNSPAWKKQQEEIQKNSARVQEYFNSPEWKKQQELIQRSADSIASYFKSDAWKKQQQDLQKSLAQTKQFFESSEWKKQQEEFKKMMEANKEMIKDSESKKK